MYKKLFITFLVIFFSQYSLAQTEQPKDGLRESEVFGLLLGVDSLAEVAKKTKYTKDSNCKNLFPDYSCGKTYKIIEYNTLEYKNKVYHIYNHDSAILKNHESGLISAEFQINGVDFHGTFFEDKIISLDTSINYDDFEGIKKSFDKKYKKKTMGSGKGEYKNDENTTYKFHRWIDEKSIFEIQITEATSFFNTVNECILFKKNFYEEFNLNATFKEFQDMCKKKIKRSSLQLNYRSVHFYPQAMNKIVEKIAEKEKLKLIENQDEKNKKTQRLNRF